MRMLRTAAALLMTALGTVPGTVPARAQPAAPAPAAGGPLRIGLLLDLSGPYADMTGHGSEVAARMAVEDFGGTVLGRPVEVVAADIQNKADVASSKAREWFSTGDVTAIMDVVGSSAALAVQQIARIDDKVLVLNAPASLSLVNENCSPTTVLYTYTTYAIAHSVGQAVVAGGGRTWFFIAADYAFGQGLVTDTSAVVKAARGVVLGSVKNPLGTTEYSSSLLTAQSSGAQVVALANAGSDMINAVKQAHDFGLGDHGQRLVALVAMISDIQSLGLPAAQGLQLGESFYWNLNDATRAWSRRFFARTGRMPTMLQAGTYSSTLHYLQSVRAAGTVTAEPVMAQMRALPIHDFFAPDGHIRADGLMVHDVYLFQVKTPAESGEPWDDYKLLATIPADRAFPPLSESTCNLVKR